MSNPTPNRSYQATDDDHTVTTHNRSLAQHHHNVANHSNAENSPPASIEMGISDSGATGHFLKDDAPVTNKQVAQNPITITLPDGNHIRSTHTCNLDIPWLPDEMTAGHVVPKLSHTSLLATRQFCDNGYEVTFTKALCKVTIEGKTVLEGPRDPNTKLWHLPINPTGTPAAGKPNNTMTNQIAHIAMNAYTMPTKQQALKFMHHTLFCPPIPTLIAAIENEQLRTFPHLTVENVQKHLEPTTATSKRRIKRNKKGIRSTQKTQGMPNVPNPQASTTYSPPAWAQIVSTLFDAHGKKVHGTTYCSPDGSLTIFLHMLGFVDDTKHHVNDMMSHHAQSVETLVSKMAQDSQLWSDLLTASGAALELSKMYFYISSWKFEQSGKPYLDDLIQTTIPVLSPDRTSIVNVPNKSVHSARRTLGPIKCPGRDQTAQYAALLKTSNAFARTIQSSAMSKREAWTAYFSFYLPKMCYVLNTSFLTKAQLQDIQKKATTALFRKCGFNRNTATAVKFGPLRIGGIGFRGLYTEQSVLLTCMVLKHLRIPDQANKLIRIALAWAQLASGVGFPILEYPDQAIPTMEDPLLNAIRSGLTHLNASIRLHDNLVRPL
jgi:hypothetical protein